MKKRNLKGADRCVKFLSAPWVDTVANITKLVDSDIIMSLIRTEIETENREYVINRLVSRHKQLCTEISAKETKRAIALGIQERAKRTAAARKESKASAKSR